jgi:hypothetical protein
MGIKTFQKLAKDKGYYGAIMYQALEGDSDTVGKFQSARRNRISPSAGTGEGNFGEQTLNVVAGAALFTDPDISRFINTLAIKATLAAHEQLKINDGKEPFAGAFEIHSVKADVPTMNCFIFYRESVEAQIRKLHSDLKKRNLPGMESFGKSGVVLGKCGLSRPYSRYGPGGEPYLHGNSDSAGGLDPSKDWKSYKVPLQFPDTPNFSDYRVGNSALATHLDDSADLPLDDLAALVCELELPQLKTHAKVNFIDDLKANSDSLGSLASKFRNEGDEARASAIETAKALLNMNLVYDVQNTRSAEFWRKFK